MSQERAHREMLEAGAGTGADDIIGDDDVVVGDEDGAERRVRRSDSEYFTDPPIDAIDDDEWYK